MILHEVRTEGGEERIRYFDIRFAFVPPTPKSPPYFLGAGAEVYDEKLDPIEGPIIRVTAEHEAQELGLDSFFDVLTDHMTAQRGEVIYCDLSKEDLRGMLYSYLDKRGLRQLTAIQIPYSDFTLRIGKVKDYDETGKLVVSKGSPLYGDLRGISRLDLRDSPEVNFYRLATLSMLVAGFDKYPPRPPLNFKGLINRRGDKSGWWMLIALIPIIGSIWFLIELGFLAGTPGPNRFGPPPTDA